MFVSEDFGFQDFCLSQEKQPLLSKLLPYRSYDPDTGLFYNEGSTGFVLMANPIVGSSLEDQQIIAEFLRQNPSLVIGASLQFLLFASPCIGLKLDYWEKSRAKASQNHPMYQKVSQRRSSFLKSKAFSDEGGHLIREFKLLISFTIPGHKETLLEQTELLNFRNQLQAVLQSLKIHAVPLTADGLIQEVGGILNMDADIYPYQGQWNEHDSLSKEMLDFGRDYEATPDGVLMNEGRTLCRSYIPKVWRRKWTLSYMDYMLGSVLRPKHQISCPYLIHYGIFVVPHQKKLKAKSLAKSTFLEKQLIGGMEKFIPDLKEQYAESREVFEELQRGGQMVMTCLSYTLFSSPDKILSHQQQLREIWGEAEWQFQATTRDHLFLLLSSLPMSWTTGYRSSLSQHVVGAATGLQTLARGKLTVSREAQNLLPLLAEWKGQPAPGMPLVGRRGQLLFWNPFGEDLLNSTLARTDSNYNISVAGKTGSGKSVFLNCLTETTLAIGGKAFVLDYGRSFEKNCKNSGGRFIDLNFSMPICVNPFTHIPTGDSEEAQENRPVMMSVAECIYKVMAAPQQGTTDLENSYLCEAIRWSWSEFGPESHVDTVREWLIRQKDQCALDLAQKLVMFTSQGKYGQFFNGPANASFQESFIVFETENLKADPILMAVLTQMLILQINQEMLRGNRFQPKLIIIEEAWRFLTGKSSGDFVESLYRIARKYKSSICCASQFMTDFFRQESPGAAAAFGSSAWKIILQQQRDVIESLKGHAQLKDFVSSPYLENVLKSIHSNPPHYSEAALFGPGVTGVVGRLRLDPFSRLLYSTNAQEYQTIQNYLKQGVSIEEAIERLMIQQDQERGHG